MTLQKKGKLAIIGSKKFKKSTVLSLLEEAEKKFERVLFAPIDKLKFSFSDGGWSILYKKSDILKFDAVYPRVNAGDRLLAEPLLKILEQSNLYCPVSLNGYRVSNHKFSTIQKLSEHKVPILDSSLSVSEESMPAMLKKFSFPLILKLISGFAGKGVMLIENKKQLSSILDTLHLYEECISAQKFVPDLNSDIRCYVIGKKIISVERISGSGDFRANVSRGGSASVVDVPESVLKIARKSANALELDICAVDVIKTNFSKIGYAIVEVNFQPGPFKKYLGNMIPQEMVKYIREKIS